MDSVVHGLEGANTNINTVQSNVTTLSTGVDEVQGNLDSFATYANTTFTGGSDEIQGNLHHFGTTANTNIDTVSSNVDAAVHGLEGSNTNIGVVQGNLDSFATYANTTFALDADLNNVSSNVSALKYFRTVDVDGGDQVTAAANAATLNFVSGSSMNIQVSGSTITFNAQNVAEGGGVVTQAFKTFAVEGSTSLVADGPADTFTFNTATSGVTLLGDGANDRLTIDVPGLASILGNLDH